LVLYFLRQQNYEKAYDTFSRVLKEDHTSKSGRLSTARSLIYLNKLNEAKNVLWPLRQDPDIRLIPGTISYNYGSVNSLPDYDYEEDEPNFSLENKHDIKSEIISTGKQKAVIIYFVRGIGDLRALTYSIKYLQQFFNKRYAYPVILFYPEGLPKDPLDNLRKHFLKEGLSLKLEEIPIVHKENATNEQLHYERYRAITKFLTYNFAQHKILENYEYIWRLEPESFILGNINYDIFSFMNEKQIKYGFTGVKSEENQLVSEAWKVTKKYLKSKSDDLPELLKR